MKQLQDKLTITDVANITGLQKSTIKRYANKGKIRPSHRDKLGRLYFDRAAVELMQGETRLSLKEKKKRFQKTTEQSSFGSDEIEIIEKWRIHSEDRASIDVEIGLLSKKIEEISDELHQLQMGRSQFLNKRRLLVRAVGERRKRLDFLRSTDTKRYYKALGRLGMCA